METSIADIEAKTAAEIAKESAELSAQAAKFAAQEKVAATKQDIETTVAKDKVKMTDLKDQAQAKAQQVGQTISDEVNTLKDNIKNGTADTLDKISAKTAQMADNLNN